MVTLAAARKNAKLTQGEFAKKAGVTKQTVVSWEKGKTNIDAANFLLLSDLSGIPATEIELPKKNN